MPLTSAGRAFRVRALPILALGLLLAAAPAAADPPRLVAIFEAWTVYVSDEGGSHVCFATAKPQSAQPAAAARATPRFQVSNWTREGIKAELSIKVGLALKKGAEVKVTVGGATYALFADGDRAWVADPTQELKLIEAMKHTKVVVVQAQPATGPATRDTYSLAGLNQALSSIASGCP